MITPAITGLFNPEALRAMVDANITCVVGDNSVTKLIPKNPYLGMWTTVDYNGYEGVFIIPRFATEIYYDTAYVKTETNEYNSRYGPQGSIPFFAANSTLDEILDREGENNFRHLALFRPDPYMFHQGNVMHFNYTMAGQTTQKEWSLVTLWLQTVVNRYKQMMTLPLLGVKQQDLRDEVYFKRIARDECGIDAVMSVINGEQSYVEVTATGDCEVGVTGLTSCTGINSGDCRIEKYGPDTTVWVQMSGDSSSQHLVGSSGDWVN